MAGTELPGIYKVPVLPGPGPGHREQQGADRAVPRGVPAAAGAGDGAADGEGGGASSGMDPLTCAAAT